MKLAQKIKEAALEIGFHRVGITSADAVSHFSFYERWIEQEYHGEMDYLKRHLDKKSNPKKVFPEARSIICLGLSYKTRFKNPIVIPSMPKPQRKLGEESPRGLISNYAWGDDYHDIMRKKLEALVARIQQWVPDLKSRIYVDTGPLLERSLAARAGIGWIGKNSCLIDKGYGSYLFLGEVLTNLGLEEDSIETDHCGSCTKCIDACPTGALTAAYTLDARRCISYLTIEKRGEFSSEEKGMIFPYLYGCDICQQVCPWNDKAVTPDLAVFHPRNGNLSPEPEEFVQLSQEEFSQRFRKSPVKRAKLNGLRRNALALIEKKRAIDNSK